LHNRKTSAYIARNERDSEDKRKISAYFPFAGFSIKTKIEKSLFTAKEPAETSLQAFWFSYLIVFESRGLLDLVRFQMSKSFPVFQVSCEHLNHKGRY
jgi:hypothetical protein